jgi:hypothetical protein
MRLAKGFVAMALIGLLLGCGAPKPPRWPSGEERPINAQQQQPKVPR